MMGCAGRRGERTPGLHYLVVFRSAQQAVFCRKLCVTVKTRSTVLSTNKILLQLYCPNGISPMGNSGCLPQGKPAATESCYPTYFACWVFKCFHYPPNSDMDHGIFNVRKDVNACDCTRGFPDTVRESALKVDPGRKSLASPGNRTCVGSVPVRYSTN